MSPTTRALRRAALPAALLTASAPLPAQQPPDGAERAAAASTVRPVARERRTLDAARRASAIAVDGRLDDAAWRDAPAAGDFRQRQPREGAPASQRTEARVLYDDDALYVGMWAWDTRADSIVAPLGRRDAAPPSDQLHVQLDSYNDRRTAFVFVLTPSGVKTDLLITNGIEADASWDAVWEGAASRDSLGWYAEFRIPLSQLRFARPGDGEEARWGLNLLRWISRHNEDAQWSLVPAGAPSWVSHYGELRGLRLRGGGRRLEVAPYTLARVERDAPAAGDPFRRATEGALTAGADVRWGVTSDLTLTAAVNPDFGQVEADPSQVNLSAFEIFQGERRPFFVEGASIFAFRTAEWWDRGELFYSRRVGRAPQGAVPDGAAHEHVPAASRLLAAAKLSGKTAGGWSLGALNAVTARERAEFVDAAGARQRATVEPLTSYGVLRLSRDFRGGESTVGAIATTVHRRLGDEPSVADLRSAAYAVGLDARHRWSGGRFELAGWAAATRVEGSERAIARTQRASARYFQRPDADHVVLDTTRTALGGAAAGARIARVAPGLRLTLAGRAYSPGFEPNDVGFLPRADLATQYASVGWERPPGGDGPFRRWFTYVNQWSDWTTGGDLLALRANWVGEVQLRSWWRVFGGVVHVRPGLSADALRGGPALRTPGRSGVFGSVASDQRRPLWVDAFAEVARDDDGGGWRADVRPRVTVRPLPQADASLEMGLARQRQPWQYVETATAAGAPAYLLASLEQRTLSVTARATWAFTPALTLQLYAQPFVSAGRYDGYGVVAQSRARRLADRVRRLDPAAVVPRDAERLDLDLGGDGRPDVTVDRPDFNRRDLNASAIARWEYRPGSSLFVVWAHARDAAADPADADGRFRAGREAGSLWRESGRHTLLVKVSHWLGV